MGVAKMRMYDFTGPLAVRSSWSEASGLPPQAEAARAPNVAMRETARRSHGDLSRVDSFIMAIRPVHARCQSNLMALPRRAATPPAESHYAGRKRYPW